MTINPEVKKVEVQDGVLDTSGRLLAKEQKRALAAEYGTDMVGCIDAVLERRSAPELAATMVYLVEMAEERYYYHTSRNFELIGTRLLGLQNNRTVSTLAMNYLILQQAAEHREDLVAGAINSGATLFLDRYNPKENSERGILVLIPVIRTLRYVFRSMVVSASTTEDANSRVKPRSPRDMGSDVIGPFDNEQLQEYVDAHNRLVRIHLDARIADQTHGINRYESYEDIRESKEHMWIQRLLEEDERLFKVFAAYVWLQDQQVEFSRSDVVLLTNLSHREVVNATSILTERAFIDADKVPQMQGLAPEDAPNSLNVQRYRQAESIDALDWQEALVYATMQQMARDTGQSGGTLQVGQREISTAAFRGFYSQNSGSVSDILSRLLETGLISRDTSTRPYTYTLNYQHDPQFVLVSVAHDDGDQLQQILDLEPQGIDFSVQPRLQDVDAWNAPEAETETEPEPEQQPLPNLDESENSTPDVEAESASSSLEATLLSKLDFLDRELVETFLEGSQVSLRVGSDGDMDITFSGKKPQED